MHAAYKPIVFTAGPNTMEWNMANTSVIYSPQSSVVTAYQSTPTSSGPFSYPVMPPLEMPHAVETHSPAVSDLSHCSGIHAWSAGVLWSLWLSYTLIPAL